MPQSARSNALVAKYRLMSVVVPQTSCGANETDCSLSVYGGFSGSDKYGVAFTTALQLSRINQFALSSYYYAAIQKVVPPLLSCVHHTWQAAEKYVLHNVAMSWRMLLFLSSWLSHLVHSPSQNASIICDELLCCDCCCLRSHIAASSYSW